MKTIYVSSYYQFSNNLYEKLDEPTKQIVDQMVDSRGTILVSRQNLNLIIHAMKTGSPYKTTSSEYLLALFSDMEVAIQEKKIMNMANLLGFSCHAQAMPGKHPRLNYLEDFPVTDMNLALKDIIQGNIYVINTHGKPHELDGPFSQAIDNPFDLERIVIDACSSAVSNKRNHKSMIAQVAEEALNKGRQEGLEIVGYTYDFATDETELTAHAIFAEKSLWQGDPRLNIITPGVIKEDRLIASKQAVDSKIKAKKANFPANITPKEAAERLLQDALIEVCSKATGSDIKTKIQQDSAASEMDELDSTNTIGIRQLFIGDYRTSTENSPKTLKKELKEQRKNYITGLDMDQLLKVSESTYTKFKSFKPNDADFRNSILYLETCISSVKSNFSPSSMEGRDIRFFQGMQPPQGLDILQSKDPSIPNGGASPSHSRSK